MSTIKDVAQSAVWYTISDFVGKSIGFLSVPIFTRVLSVEEFGKYNNWNSWMLIFMVVSGMELFNTINRMRFEYESQRDQLEYSFSCMVLSMIVTASLYIGYQCFKDQVYSITKVEEQYMLPMFLYLLLRPTFDIFLMQQRIAYHYKLAATLSLGTALTGTILAVFLVTCTSFDNLQARIIGQYAPSVLAALLIFLSYLGKVRKLIIRYWKPAIQIGLPLVVTYLGNQIMLQGGRIIVMYFEGADEVAYVALAINISYILTTLFQSISNALSPWIMDMLNSQKEKQIKWLINNVQLLSIPMAMTLMLLSKEIVFILGGDAYNNSVILIPYFITSSFIYFIVTQLITIETYEKRVMKSSLLTLVSAGVNLVLGIGAVTLFGYPGIGYSTLIANVTLLVFHLAVVGITNCKSAIDARVIIRSIAILIGFGVMIEYVLPHLVLRCICLCLLIIIAILTAKRFMRELRDFEGSGSQFDELQK